MRRLQGILYGPDGTPLGGYVLVLTALSAQPNGLMPGTEVVVPTDADGFYSAELLAGYYRVYQLAPGAIRRENLGLITVTDGAMPQTIGQLLNVAGLAPDVVQQVLDEWYDQLEALEQAAEQTAQAISEDRVAVEGMKQAAETAAQAAEEDRVAVEGMKQAAETAAQAAEEDRVAVEGMKQAAEQAAQATGEDRAAVEGMKQAAETAATTATQQAGIATTKASEAADSAQQAADSAQAAGEDRVAVAGMKQAAETAATTATQQAGIATTKASEAAGSASAAAQSAASLQQIVDRVDWASSAYYRGAFRFSVSLSDPPVFLPLRDGACDILICAITSGTSTRTGLWGRFKLTSSGAWEYQHIFGQLGGSNHPKPVIHNGLPAFASDHASPYIFLVDYIQCVNSHYSRDPFNFFTKLYHAGNISNLDPDTQVMWDSPAGGRLGVWIDKSAGSSNILLGDIGGHSIRVYGHSDASSLQGAIVAIAGSTIQAKIANDGVAIGYGITPTFGHGTLNAANGLYDGGRRVLPIGVGQTWQDVKAQRAWGTTYTNTTGRPIAVHIYSGSFSGAVVIMLTIDGVTFTSPYVENPTDGKLRSTSIFAIIPPGAAYKANGDYTITQWNELR